MPIHFHRIEVMLIIFTRKYNYLVLKIHPSVTLHRRSRRVGKVADACRPCLQLNILFILTSEEEGWWGTFGPN
jgi:hypothetical protein